MSAKFRYYITDTFNGKIKGTNDRSAADSFAAAEDYFVVDTVTNTWLMADNEEQEVQEMLAEKV